MKTIQDEILLVIPYIKSTQGRELELSLTGWRKYCTSPLRIIVIGEYDPCIEGKEEFIEAPRAEKLNGQYMPNIDVARKLDMIYERFHNEYDHFVLANDDEYPVRPFDWSFLTQVTYLQTSFIGNLSAPTNYWSHDMGKTRVILDKLRKPHVNYCNHHPFYFNMETFHKMSQGFDLANNSLIRENLYYNIYHEGATKNVNDIRYGFWDTKSTKENFRKNISNKNIVFMCNSVAGWSEELMNMLDEHYNGVGRFVNNVPIKQKNSEYPFGVSVCISAWETSEYIEECLDSVSNQTWFKEHDNWEILLGIDGCEKTLAKVKEIMNKYKNLRVMMMDNNVGTYVTCNTIIKESKYEWIMRFDSDDVMNSDMVETVMNRISKNDLDILTIRCTDGNRRNIWAEGQLIIRRKSFLDYGGFLDRRCGCDTEIKKRTKGKLRQSVLDKELFYRRPHPNSLTHRKETNMTSPYREEVKRYIRDISPKKPILDLATAEFTWILNQNQIIVSFTTWKKRQDCAAKMLDHFKKQTMKPDKIYCWLSTDEYGGKNIPKSLQRFVDDRFIEIKWIKENTYCHKRHEVFKEHINDYVFLIDDDILYDENYIKDMYASALEHPSNVICWCTYNIDYTKDKRLYRISENPSIRNGLMTGISCFPPKVYPIECFNYLDIRDKLAPKCDDSFIQAFLIKNDISIYSVYDRMKKNFTNIKEYQYIGIWETENKRKINGITKKTLIFKSLIKELKIEEKVKEIWKNIVL